MTKANPELTTERIDAISLEQALRDFENANARVVVLTQRLLASESERKRLADELERLRLRVATTPPPPPPPAPIAPPPPPSPLATRVAKAPRALAKRALRRLKR